MKVPISLPTRLALLVMASIFPLLALSLVKVFSETRVASARAAGNLQRAASLVALHQRQVVDSAVQLLKTIAAVPAIRDGDLPRCNEYLSNLKSALSAYTTISTVGADGYVQCSTLALDGPVYIGDRTDIRAAFTSQHVVSGTYMAGVLPGQALLPFVSPVVNGDGKISAVVYAALDLQQISKSFAAVPMPVGASIGVYDRDGVLLSGASSFPIAIGERETSPIFLAALRDRTAGVAEGVDRAGVQRLWAFVPEQSPANAAFFVAVSAPRSFYLSPIYREVAIDLSAMLTMALAGSLIAWLLGRRLIIRPIHEISRATLGVRAGDLHERVALAHVGPTQEFKEIARGFNQMADALQCREEDLKIELNNTQRAQATLKEAQQAQAKSHVELREVQRKLLDAQQLCRVGYWEFDQTSQKHSWSDGLRELFGLVPGSFDGNHATFLQMIHPADRVEYERRQKQAIEAGVELDIEYRIITPDGAVRWLHQLGRSHMSQDGLTVYRAGVVQEITARKESELALAATADLLRRTGEMAIVGGWELVLDGMQLICSDQLLRIHDLEPGTTLTVEEARDAYVPGARRAFVAAAEAAMAHGTPWDLEFSLVTAKGRTIWVRSRGQAVMKNGVVHRLTGAVQDITVQHESQVQLRLLEKCISHLNDIVLITEAEPFNEPGPRIVFVNDAFERRTGYSREEVLGKSPRVLQGPKTQRAELDRIGAALKKWQPVRSELINYTKSGQEFWLELDIVPIANTSGWFTHWVAVERDITHRKLAEQALMDSEQRYTALFETAPVPMWVIDRETGQFLTVNSAAVKAYGYSSEELLSMTLFDICPASEHVRLRQELAEAIPGSERKNTWLQRRKDGSVFPASLFAQTVLYGDKAWQFTVALDATAQVKAEKDAQEHLFTLQRAADAAQAITWHQTLHGTLQEVAEQARGVIGTNQAVVSLAAGSDASPAITVVSLSEKYAPYREMIKATDGSGIYAMVAESNRSVRMTQAELEAHPRWRGYGDYADKHPTMRGWLAIPLTSRSGKNMGVLQLSDKYDGEFTLRDEYVAIELAHLASIAIQNAQLIQEVSQLNAGLERKVTERTVALARQEALFRGLAEQAPQVVWTSDAHGAVTYLNRAWFELVGGELQDWAGTRWFAAIHPEDLPEIRANWRFSEANGSPFTGTRRLRAKNGSYHTMSYRGTPVLDAQGSVLFWVGIDADISEMKTVEAALRLSNQELEAFSYSVSHDLRAPLNTIDGFSRLLSKQVGGDAHLKAQHYLSRIQMGVAQMGRLIEDLLSLSQVSRMQLRYEEVDLSALSQSIVDDWRGRQPERQVAVHIEDGLKAQCDGRLVKVLMENLLGNAWKFTSREDNASIHVGQTPDAAGQPEFFIRDNGVGFDMAYVDKLFVAFQRLHTVSEFPGTGIGLATASRVVNRHGGQIWVESVLGRGATFFFTLPPVVVSL